MNRDQAVTVIKEIFEKCQMIGGKSLKLLPPKGNDTLSNTFQIYIETGDNNFLTLCVENIAKEHDLEVMCKDGYCIIYKPYPNINEH
jgi:hypothetical protein